MSNVPNNMGKTAEVIRLLKLELSNYSIETVKAAIAQGTFTAEQIKAILTAKGLTDAEIQEVITTKALTASQTGATASTLGLGTAIKGLGIKLKSLAMAHPVLLAITAAIAAIGAIFKYWEYEGKALERQQEKLEEALSAYEDVKSELESINSELDENKKKISELEAKPKLTYAEKGQLEELKRITEQLELQKEISEWQLGNKQKEAAMESVAYVNTKYNLGDSNAKDVDALVSDVLAEDYRNFEAATNSDVTDAEYLAARYKAMLDKTEDLRKEAAELLKNDEIFPEDIAMAEYDVETYEGFTEELKTEINDMLSSLMEQKANIQDYYDTIKDTPYEDMSTDARNCYDTMQQIDASIQTLYYGLGNNRFNSEIIDGIFNTEGIELTKEKLVEMAQAGTLSPAVIASHEKLADAILNSNLVADEGCGLFETLCNEIYALAEAGEEAADNMGNMSPTLSITDTIDQLNTRLKPTMDSLKSAYKDIFTSDVDLNSIDILSTCDSIKSKLDEMSDPEGLNLDIDYSAYEDFARVLRDSESDATDVQGAFDKLATSIVQAGLSGTEDFKTLKAALGDLGVANNETIAFQELCQNTEALKDAGLDLKNATEEQMEAFVNETVSAENAAQALAYLELCKMSVNNARVETKEDVERILSLAKTAGIGADALAKLEKFKIDLENETDPKARQWILQTINEYTKTLASEIESVQVDVDVDPTTTTSSAKDTTETFDWIQQAIEKVEKEVQKLDDTVNSSYSTFSQKNKALAQEIEKVNEEIGLQQKAYEEYMQKAESVGLGDDYKTLVRDGAINIENISNENLKTAISDYQKWYEKAQSVSDAISDLNEKIKDLHVSGYELKADRLEELLDSESITEKQYLTEMESLYKEYYENQVEYAQKAHEAKLALLEKEKSYLNSVANAASSLLDKEIDKIQDNAKAQESIYQEQIDLLNKKKKPLQDELDALEDKAKEEDLILDLQKKQYELKRAENQRDKFMYKDGQMIYTNDEQNVRSAQNDVDDAQLELQKYEIQKQIDALDEEIDRYNDLIDAVNESADNQVDALEKIKNKWQEVIDQQEYAQNLILLTGEFGADAITKILTGNDDDLLAQWKNSYINTLADIDMESQGYIGDMTNQIASLYGIDLSPLQNQFSGVKNSVSDMTDALGEAAAAIGIGNTANNTSANQDIAENGNPQSSPTENSLKSAIENETATAISSFDQHTDKLNNEVVPAIQSATAEMEIFNETADMDIEKTVTINYVVNGGSGASHVEGTAKVSGDWSVQSDESKALVGEVGRELIVRNGRFFTVGDNGAEMTDIRKGDIVFNHEQTEELLKNGHISGHGKAYADGTVGGGKFLTPDGKILRPLQPGDKMYDMMQKWKALIIIQTCLQQTQCMNTTNRCTRL